MMKSENKWKTPAPSAFFPQLLPYRARVKLPHIRKRAWEVRYFFGYPTDLAPHKKGGPQFCGHSVISADVHLNVGNE
jgi:hypothetical protein